MLSLSPPLSSPATPLLAFLLVSPGNSLVAIVKEILHCVVPVSFLPFHYRLIQALPLSDITQLAPFLIESQTLENYVFSCLLFSALLAVGIGDFSEFVEPAALGPLILPAPGVGCKRLVAAFVAVLAEPLP